MIYKEFQNQRSLMDYLVNLMPGVDFTQMRMLVKPKVNQAACRKLFTLWRDNEHKNGNKLLARPSTVSMEEIDLMQREGLVRLRGDKIEVTSKGTDIIKTMILGDDKSVYDDDGNIVDYTTAYAFTKTRKTKTGKKAASVDSKLSEGWYKRMKGICE